MNNYKIEDLEKIFTEVYKQPKVKEERTFSFITGVEGQRALNKAFDILIYLDKLTADKFTNTEINNLKLMLNSSIYDDYVLAKRIIDVKYSR